MNYEKRYLSLADSLTGEIVESAMQGKTYGLGARPKKEISLDMPEDVQTKYMGFTKAIFEDLDLGEEEEKVRTEPDPEVGLQDVYMIDPKEGPQKRPQGRSDVVPEAVKKDPAFMQQIERLSEKYGVNPSQIYKVIQGESGFNPKATNKSGASGLFQFMPKTAAELGWTTEEILSMAPAEQAKVYEQYLDFWGYDGSNALGIMQAAPAFANASPETVVYKKGSKAWDQNPGWRTSGDGDITVASINNYYRKQGL